MIGVDNLGDMNRDHGHDVADEIVCEICERIFQSAPPGAVIEAISGARIGLIARCADKSDCVNLGLSLRQAVGSKPIDTSVGPVIATISVGSTLLGDLPGDPIAAAQEALDLARLRGPDSFHHIGEAGEALAERRKRQTIVSEVTQALAEDRIALAFQPIVKASEEKVAFHECLVRMIDQEGRAIAAGQFMPAIEGRACVLMVDRAVVRLAFEALAASPMIRLSINVSPRTMLDSVWLRTFEELADSHPYAAERLIVEITESAAVMDPMRAIAFMDRLRERGVSFALDDFGAGYTSFRHLRDLRFDIVKIDGGFVRDLHKNGHNQMFVGMLAEIGRKFDMIAVAEFVETEDEVLALRELGVDFCQGYHFGKPQLAPKWLEKDDRDAS
jgi:EAL domain-containing protein (putative c-di-GMP-specific phosphodiesterase class I)